MKRYKIQVSRTIYASDSDEAIEIFITLISKGKDFIKPRELLTSKYKNK